MRPYNRSLEKGFARNHVKTILDQIASSKKEIKRNKRILEYAPCEFIDEGRMCDCSHPCLGYKAYTRRKQHEFLIFVKEFLYSLESPG